MCIRDRISSSPEQRVFDGMDLMLPKWFFGESKWVSSRGQRAKVLVSGPFLLPPMIPPRRVPPSSKTTKCGGLGCLMVDRGLLGQMVGGL